MKEYRIILVHYLVQEENEICWTNELQGLTYNINYPATCALTIKVGPVNNRHFMD